MAGDGTGLLLGLHTFFVGGGEGRAGGRVQLHCHEDQQETRGQGRNRIPEHAHTVNSMTLQDNAISVFFTRLGFFQAQINQDTEEKKRLKGLREDAYNDSRRYDCLTRKEISCVEQELFFDESRNFCEEILRLFRRPEAASQFRELRIPESTRRDVAQLNNAATSVVKQEPPFLAGARAAKKGRLRL